MKSMPGLRPGPFFRSEQWDEMTVLSAFSGFLKWFGGLFVKKECCK